MLLTFMISSKSMGAYLKELTSGFGKTTSRQFGRARDVVADTAHDAEATCRGDNGARQVRVVGFKQARASLGMSFLAVMFRTWRPTRSKKPAMQL